MKNIVNRLAGDVGALCRLLFKDDRGEPLEICDYQKRIMETILYEKSKKTLCWATTRAGKSLAVALALILVATFRKGKKIRIIAPTKDHTAIIMNYITQHILDHDLIIGQLEGMGEEIKTVERLRKQISKNRITFKNNNEIMIITASISMQGRSLIGHGGNLIVIDETEQIPAEIIRTKVMRMLGDSPDSIVFMISNPSAKGFMYEAMHDSSWKQIKIHWQDCVKEGRLSKEFVMEQKRELTDIEFKIWYESEYPEDYEDTLIRWSWIERARDRDEFKLKKADVVWGLDVAEFGNDLTVLTGTETDGKRYNIKAIHSWGKTDTMRTVGKCQQYRLEKGETIYVDATGVGSGVHSRLDELGYDSVPVKVGKSPEKVANSERFLNQKAQFYWRLRTLFEHDKISIPNHRELIKQLSQMRYEMTSSKKIKIIDPGEKTLDGVKVGKHKSPDFADSLMLCCSEAGGRVLLEFA